ncbi:MAG: tetratricopeptide repeat protein, partial [Verrucomicrobiae bacterium]|nr:tetratricopeptide repeat protein [Verrucomicrobiae bacterium]
MDALAQRLIPSGEARLGWGGMDMFIQQQVRRDDPRLSRLHDHFRSNLDQIIRMGTNAGAKVIVSTMVSNLRDWPPFGSLHRPKISQGRLDEWQRLYELGIKMEKSQDPDAAVRYYAKAAEIDDEFAELHYRWARCSLAKGDIDDAKARFVLARDLDTLRFRTDSRFNSIIRKVTSGYPTNVVRLLEAEDEFNARSPYRIVGNEFLYEHVHFTFAGNYLLARLFADQIASFLEAGHGSTTSGNVDWLSEAECATRLAYTETQRYEISSLLLRRFHEPVYRRQLEYQERLNALQREVAQLRAAAKPAARRRGLDACREAIARSPNDWVLHDLAARLLTALEEYSEAEKEWLEVARLLPHCP